MTAFKSPYTNHGDSIAGDFVPQIAGNCVYNFIPANFRQFTASGGSTSATDRMFQVNTGTSASGYGAIQSFRTSNYKVGQKMACRFGAIFPTTAVTSNWQGVGLLNLGDEVSFGYHGRDFGIWHRYGGLAEIQELELTAAAGGAETATVTLNGVAYNVSLTGGTDEQTDAYELAADLSTNATGWTVEQLGTKVYFIATSDGDKASTFSYSSTGTSAGTFTEITAGVTKTSHFYPQASAGNTLDGDEGDTVAGVLIKGSWNGEKVDWLDPAKGNNYEILVEDGFSNLHFFVEHRLTGEYILVHSIKWPNLNTEPNFGNPSLRTGMYAVNITNTSDIKVQCSDISVIALGSQEKTRNSRAVQNTKTSSTTLTNILTLRNSAHYNGYTNQIEVAPETLTVANASNKNIIVELRGNATVAGPTNFQAVGTNLATELDTTGGAVTENSGRLFRAYPITAGDSREFDLTAIKLAMPPTLRITVAAKQVASGTSGEITVGFGFYEDI